MNDKKKEIIECLIGIVGLICIVGVSYIEADNERKRMDNKVKSDCDTFLKSCIKPTYLSSEETRAALGKSSIEAIKKSTEGMYSDREVLRAADDIYQIAIQYSGLVGDKVKIEAVKALCELSERLYLPSNKKAIANIICRLSS